MWRWRRVAAKSNYNIMPNILATTMGVPTQDLYKAGAKVKNSRSCRNIRKRFMVQNISSKVLFKLIGLIIKYYFSHFMTFVHQLSNIPCFCSVLSTVLSIMHGVHALQEKYNGVFLISAQRQYLITWFAARAQLFYNIKTKFDAEMLLRYF